MNYAKILTLHKNNSSQPFMIMEYDSYFQNEKGVHITTIEGDIISVKNFSEIVEYVAENEVDHNNLLRAMKMMNLHLEPI